MQKDKNNWEELGIPQNDDGKKIGQQIGQHVNQSERKEEKKDEPVQYYESFELMNLKETLFRGICAYGFEVPAKIQQCCIPLIASGNDVIAQSQAGTGKTGAFTCGILQLIDENELYPQALIISPTRELSTQIESVIIDLGQFMKIRTTLCVGGTSVDNNIRDIRNTHIIIGTPGRIIDLIERRAFNPDKIKVLIMDEADVLLSKEFLIQTKNIITKLSDKAQICAFSATLPNEVITLMNKFMTNPVNILVQKEKLSLDLIVQYYVDVDEDKYKLEVLDDLYKGLSIGQCIIYVNYKGKAKWLKDKLSELGHAVEAIYSDLLPAERTNIMKQYRSGDYRVLISTDLLARGIDIQQVGYVINYDLPVEMDQYLHRIGRSGRYGKKGIAVNFVTRRDRYMLKTLSDRFKVKIEAMPEPQYLNDYLAEKKYINID